MKKVAALKKLDLLLERKAGVNSYAKKFVNSIKRNGVSGTCRKIGLKLIPASDSFDIRDSDRIPPSYRGKTYPELTVGVIMDDFSLAAWSAEFSVVQLDPAKYRSQILGQEGDPRIDLLFVESAWNGNGGAWQYQLAGSNAPSDKVRDLVALCDELSIPTTFWNKEDPPHFEDFLSTAQLFKHIFTTDESKIPDYESRTDALSVEVLPFAAQPSIHNPIKPSSTYRSADVAFAGMYFAHKFPERREQIDLILEGAIAAVQPNRKKLVIYSRYEGEDERYQFPRRYAANVAGSLPYRKMLLAYRKYKILLNVNSVVTSPSMCSRRIFEAIASGATLISTPSPALNSLFGKGAIVTVSDAEDARRKIKSFLRSSELRDRRNHKLQRLIWREHTYAQRATKVVKVTLGDTLAMIDEKPIISVIASTNRPEQLGHIFEQVRRQQDVRLELNLATHGFKADEQQLAELIDSCGVENVHVFETPVEWTLGRCLNQLVDHCSGGFIAKMDDDDLYGPQYLADLYDAWGYSGADLLGKQAVYVSLETEDLHLLKHPDKEQVWTDFVAGPTLFGPARTFKNYPFEDRTRGEDSAFISSLLRSGKHIYSSDRFNFVQVRHAKAHTWQTDSWDFLANGDVKVIGSIEDHINA